MLKINKKLISMISAVVLSNALVLGSVSLPSVEVSAATSNEVLNNYGLTNNTADGTILHAFSWSFNTIKSKMKEIADSGYSSVQVSPIQSCYQNGGGQHTWEWENTYQPTNYKIGNYVVGSRDEFISMCNEAHKYGIKVIVDVVSNHISSHFEQVDSSLKKDSLLHGFKDEISSGGGWEWGDRWSLTQKRLMGMPDLNTHSSEVQNIIKGYLDDCINCGADGFRFDTTKHIELPQYIDGSFGSDFWPNIVNEIKSKKSDAFIYGEVLQGDGDAYSGYSNYLGLTADSYGRQIREAVGGHKLIDKDILDYKSEGVSSSKLVVYSETHDTYANKDGESRNLNNWQVKKGYEIVTARAKGTPLFLARPQSTGRNWEGKLEGPLGQPSNDWNDKEVAAVNKFHNAMVGKNEYIRKVSNETIAIERGNVGEVVINLNGGYTGDLDTSLRSGTYKDLVSGKYVNVSNGKIHLDLKSGQTAVIFNDTTSKPDPVKDRTAYLRLPSDWSEPYAYVYENAYGKVKENASWPGVKMTKVSNGLYKYQVSDSFSEPLVIFNDKNRQYPSMGSTGLSLNGNMILDGSSWSVYKDAN